MTIQVEILQFLHYNPSSSRIEITAGLTEVPNERTLKRLIADGVQLGDIVVKGRGKATRYSLSAQAQLMMPLTSTPTSSKILTSVRCRSRSILTLFALRFHRLPFLQRRSCNA